MKGETPTTPTTLPVKLNLPDGTCGVVYNQKIDLAPLQRTMQNIISCEADGFEAAGLSFSWEDELQIDGVPQKHGLFPITILLNFGAENEKSSQAYRLRGDLSILADLRKRTQDDSLSEKLLDLNIHAIQNNPYRTLGLLVGATKREQERHLKRLKHFIDAEIEVEDDWSFPILGELNRTIDSINDASSKLNLDGDKMSAALFWFYNGNAITDETAFEAIKDGNTEIAIDIWRKLACRSTDEPYNEITSRNASAFHNLSTLYLQKYGIDEETLQLKLLFLESDYFRELKNRATDETYRISQKEIQLMFLNILIQDNSIETDELIEAISNIEFSAKEVFLTGFIQKPLQELDAIINECNQRRQSKMTDVIVAGTNLYNKSKSRLSQLEEILGASDLRYTAMADKVATEVLQCGIQLFNDYKDSKTYDPGEPAMALFLKATLIAKGTIARQRCQENTESIQEWIESKPEREFQNKVGNEVDYIIKKLNLAVATLNNKGKYPKGYNDPYSNLPFDQQPHNRDDSNYRKEIDDFLRSESTYPFSKNENIINLFRLSRDLVKECKPMLDKIKLAVGQTNDIYQKLSNEIASIALACLIGYVNGSTARALGLPHNVDEHEINSMNAIGELDMNFELRKRYDEQKKSLSKLHKSNQNRNSTPKSSSSNTGCYIATMVYGDYDHPQVIILRQFRDEVLDQSTVGKWFIRTYYRLSPKLVAQLKNKKSINIIIRKTLNQFIKLIKL